MQVLIPYPLTAAGAAALNSLAVGDGFLRVDANGDAAPNFWIRGRLDASGNADIFNPIDGSFLTGVAGNMPVVPYAVRIVPIS